MICAALVLVLVALVVAAVAVDRRGERRLAVMLAALENRPEPGPESRSPFGIVPD